MEVVILKNAECVALTAADLDCHQTQGKQQQFWNSNDLMGLQHADQYQRRPEYLFYTDKCHARLH